MEHPFCNFVDGTVAAGGYNEIGPPGNVFARKTAGAAGPLGGSDRNPMPRLFEDLDGVFHPRRSIPSRSASVFIKNQDGIPVKGYGLFPSIPR
jgi:hypothetical protein